MEKVLKNCRVCGVELTLENTYKSSIKRKDWICKECKALSFKKIKDNYKYKKRRPNYIIEKSSSSISPVIKIKEHADGKFNNLIEECLEDTEKYRVDKLLNFLRSSELKDSEKRLIILYLLRSKRYLLPEQIAYIINIANRMFSIKNPEYKIVIQFAKELKNIIDKYKFLPGVNKIKSYEELLRDNQSIEITNGNRFG